MIILIILYSFLAFGEELLKNKLELKDEIWNSGFLDAKGDLITISKDKAVGGKISLYDELGKPVRQWDLEKYPYTIQFMAFGLKNGDILTVVADLGKFTKDKKVFNLQASSGPKFSPEVNDIGQFVDLEQDLVAMTCNNTCPYIYTISTRGNQIKKVETSGPQFIAGTSSNDLLVSIPNKIFLYDRNLSLKAEYTEPDLKIIQGMMLLTKNGNIVVATEKNELLFLTPNLKLISRFKAGNNFTSMENMQDNKIAAINRDEYLYFFDQNGVEKAKHHHESTAANHVTYCGKNAVYFNRTELVFVNTEGKELSTYKMPDPQKSAYLHPLKNNMLVVKEGPEHGPHTLYFVKCPLLN